MLQHERAVGGIALSPDGKLIASNSSDDTVRLWSTIDGRERFRLAGHEQLGLYFRLVQFTPDSRRLAAWGGDMYLRLWDTANGKAVVEHDLQAAGLPGSRTDEHGRFAENPAGAVDTTAFSPDCRLFAAEFKQQIHVLDVPSGQEIHRLPLPPGGLHTMVFTPDAQQLVTLQGGQPVQTQMADGRVRYTSEPINTIRAWQLGSAKPRLEITLPGSGFNRVAVSADGRLLAAGIGRQPAEIVICDLQTGEERLRLKTDEGAVRRLAFSPDGRRLATGLSSGSAIVWDIAAVHQPRE
jgi:WD40 repeat protein